MYFVQCDHTPLSTACEYRKEDIVQYLLTLPDVDVATVTTEPTDHESEARERTALHIAAAHNSINIVKLLIEKEHPLTVKDENVSNCKLKGLFNASLLLSGANPLKYEIPDLVYLCICMYVVLVDPTPDFW